MIRDEFTGNVQESASTSKKVNAVPIATLIQVDKLRSLNLGRDRRLIVGLVFRCIHRVLSLTGRVPSNRSLNR